MTVIDRYHQKYSLPRAGLPDFWVQVESHFAQSNPEVWRDLALFALKETAGWSLDQIGLVFHLNPGHVSRRLNAIRQRLREHLRTEPLAQHIWDILTDPDYLPSVPAAPSRKLSRTESPHAPRNASRRGPETGSLQPPKTAPTGNAGLRTPEAFAD